YKMQPVQRMRVKVNPDFPAVKRCIVLNIIKRGVTVDYISVRCQKNIIADRVVETVGEKFKMIVAVFEVYIGLEILLVFQLGIPDFVAVAAFVYAVRSQFRQIRGTETCGNIQ